MGDKNEQVSETAPDKIKVFNYEEITINIFTPVRSTPVRAWIAGGRVPTNLLISFVVLSLPPR